MYAIKRTDQWGGYVAKPGRKSSYVVSVEHAHLYATREAAEGNRCVENEVVVDVMAILHPE